MTHLLPSPKEVMAIEVYSGPASVPQWLPIGPQAGKSSCGAILVWTRDGSLNQSWIYDRRIRGRRRI